MSLRLIWQYIWTARGNILTGNKWLIVALLCTTALLLSACKSSKPAVAPTTQPSPTITPSAVVAQVKIKSGVAEFRAKDAAAFVPAADGVGVSVGDRVRSTPGAQVAVEFLDGSSLVLLENTEIEIQNYEVTRNGDSIVSRVGRVAVLSGDVTGDVREDLVYPPSVFEIVTKGEIYTVKGTISDNTSKVSQ